MCSWVLRQLMLHVLPRDTFWTHAFLFLRRHHPPKSQKLQGSSLRFVVNRRPPPFSHLCPTDACHPTSRRPCSRRSPCTPPSFRLQPEFLSGCHRLSFPLWLFSRCVDAMLRPPGPGSSAACPDHQCSLVQPAHRLPSFQHRPSLRDRPTSTGGHLPVASRAGPAPSPSLSPPAPSSSRTVPEGCLTGAGPLPRPAPSSHL